MRDSPQILSESKIKTVLSFRLSPLSIVKNTTMNETQVFNKFPSPWKANEILNARLDTMGEKRDMRELKYSPISFIHSFTYSSITGRFLTIMG